MPKSVVSLLRTAANAASFRSGVTRWRMTSSNAIPADWAAAESRLPTWLLLPTSLPQNTASVVGIEASDQR